MKYKAVNGRRSEPRRDGAPSVRSPHYHVIPIIRNELIKITNLLCKDDLYVPGELMFESLHRTEESKQHFFFFFLE